MKKFLLTILELILLYLAIGGSMAYVDYMRMKTGETPFFCLKEYSKKNQVETCKSLLYQSSRTTKYQKDETLYHSKNISYQLFYALDIPVFKGETSNHILLSVDELDTCDAPANLYYKGENYSIYTSCIPDIIVIQDDQETSLKDLLEKDPTFIYQFENLFDYKGNFVNHSAFETFSKDTVSQKKLKMYECYKENMNDYYIGSENMIYRDDFCIPKES